MNRPDLETLEAALEYIEELEANLDAQEYDQEWPIVIQLDVPVQLGKKGSPVDTITIREPTLGDLHGVKINITETTFDDLLRIGAKLTGQPLPLLKKIRAKQGKIITEAARRFFVDCL